MGCSGKGGPSGPSYICLWGPFRDESVGDCPHEKNWIDFQRNRVVVAEEDGGFQTKTSARSIPYKHLRDRVNAELKRYFDYNDAVGVSRATVFRRVKKMARRAGLARKVSPEALRSTCAVQLAGAEIDAKGLSQFMGWKELNTAQKYIEQFGAEAETQIKRNKDKLW